ncbi:hypothetical protein [Pseudoalteromonas sp. XMcav11-Q]|uniref:hypothetical protein n=1 Tax=Pseudoalteromonas sp. XMcav11-Q TaxID=3136665 RepID=UPI0032C4546B
MATLATELTPLLRSQIAQADKCLKLDSQNEQYAGVWMPNALARTYPSANKSIAWQYLFPSYKLSVGPETGEIRRHHFHQTGVRKVDKEAAKKAQIKNDTPPHR